MVRVRTLALLYKNHIKTRTFREFLALMGIAAGVALLFAVQVANKSVTGSFKQLTEGVAGRAEFEMASRGPQGFRQDLYEKVKQIPDVDAAAPVVERRIGVEGPNGRRALTLVGFDERLTRLGGSLTRRFARQSEDLELGLYLTAPTTKAIGTTKGGTVTVKVGEIMKRMPLAGVLPEGDIGPLAESPVALAHLGFAQELASMKGKITRILVAPIPGHEPEVKAALTKLAAGKIDVRPVDTEAKLLDKAATADRQSSALFSAISVMLGMLLAYNAMLLSLSERRRDVAALYSMGATRKTIIKSLTFDALVLGLAGSVVGIFLGDQISRYVFNQVPEFLSTAFAIGSQRVVDPEMFLLSIAGGILAALAAAAKPAIELLRVGPTEDFSDKEQDATTKISSTANRRLAWGGASMIVAAIVVSRMLPETSIFTIGAVLVGLVMILPVVIAYSLVLALRLVRRTDSGAARIAVSELITTPVRATALAMVGALAVFGIVGITGPARDVARGLDNSTSDFLGSSDIAILPGGKENTFGTQPFNQESAIKQLRSISEVESVRTYRSSFLDVDGRRIWIVGKSRDERTPISSRQLIDGDLNLATKRLRQGGWIALTETLARERDLTIGQEFSLPTVSGEQRFKLAATITNYGWPNGTAIINGDNYAQFWKTQDAGGLQVDLADGISAVAGKRAIEDVLSTTSSGLRVQTTDERLVEIAKTTTQGLDRVNQIADMVLVAVVLAIAAAMLGTIWQRRRRLWGLVSIGTPKSQIYRTIYYETGVILLLGCMVGAAFGFLGQSMGSRWLQMTADYPVPFEPAIGLALQTIILATLFSVFAVAVAVRLAFSTKRIPDLAPE